MTATSWSALNVDSRVQSLPEQRDKLKERPLLPPSIYCSPRLDERVCRHLLPPAHDWPAGADAHTSTARSAATAGYTRCTASSTNRQRNASSSLDRSRHRTRRRRRGRPSGHLRTDVDVVTMLDVATAFREVRGATGTPGQMAVFGLAVGPDGTAGVTLGTAEQAVAFDREWRTSVPVLQRYRHASPPRSMTVRPSASVRTL